MTKELVKRVDDFTDSILMDAEDFGTCEGMSAQAILDEMGDILPDEIRDDLVAEAAWELKQIGKEDIGKNHDLFRDLDPDDRDDIANYYEQNYTMDHGFAVNLLSNVIDYAFTEIKDRDKRIDFLDYVLEDFRKNAGEER